MYRILIMIVFLFSAGKIFCQPVIGADAFMYAGTGAPTLISPVIHYETASHWYAEARYNYEDINTLSLYAGHVFAKENNFSYSFTPMIGLLTGRLKGGAIGLNSELSYKKFSFSSQAQYILSSSSKEDNFFYNWSELLYQPADWIFTGVAVQHTKPYATNPFQDPGVVLGFSYNNWSFPLYSFNSFTNDRYFVLGINWEMQLSKKKTKKVDIPVQ